MRAILEKKGIERARAERAVKETLDLAASTNLAKPRRELACRRIDTGQRAADELCRRFDSFVSELAKLPPSSKSALYRSIQRPLACGFFDTEIFFSVLDVIAATLPGLSPKARADAAYAALFEGDPANKEPSAQSSPQSLWEELDAETRRKCEMKIETTPPTEISLFMMLADSFRTPVHSFARGAPPSLVRDYVRCVDRIWHRLGIKKGRRRNDVNTDKGKRSSFKRHLSSFAKFTNEALAAAGIESPVSDRQIKQAIGTRKKRPLLG